MQFYWLNDSLTIKSENGDERHALAILLKAVDAHQTQSEGCCAGNGEGYESRSAPVSRTLENGIDYVVIGK
jgi:hypothetical protein